MSLKATTRQTSTNELIKSTSLEAKSTTQNTSQFRPFDTFTEATEISTKEHTMNSQMILDKSEYTTAMKTAHSTTPLKVREITTQNDNSSTGSKSRTRTSSLAPISDNGYSDKQNSKDDVSVSVGKR